MPDPTDQNTDDLNNEDQSKKNQNTAKTPEQLEEERIEALVADRVKGIKEKLDGAYSARDAALSEAEKLKQAARDRELKDLEDAGKLTEAAELRLAEERARNEQLTKRNTELTRDLSLNGALSNLPFRSDRARGMAYQEIVGELVQDDKGNWLHKTGVSISDFVKAYAADEEHAFLLKPKNSSGGGLGQPGNGGKPSTGDKSIFDLSQDEVLKLAAEGKLPRR